MARRLGLGAKEVALVPHSTEWSVAFAGERRRLQALLGSLVSGIEHVGSTAVPGLAAKPIIDIAVATDLASSFERIDQLLRANGYRYLRDAGDDGGHIFVRGRSADVRTHHLHLIDEADVQWRNYLAFRDLLRSDESVRARYAALKTRLAASFPNDRDAYTSAKADFVEQALDAARG